MNQHQLEKENRQLKIRVAQLESQVEGLIQQKAASGSVILPKSAYAELMKRKLDEDREHALRQGEVAGLGVVEFMGFEHTSNVYNTGAWMVGYYYLVVPNSLTLYGPNFDPKDPYTLPDFRVTDMHGAEVYEELVAFRPVNAAAEAVYRQAGLMKEV